MECFAKDSLYGLFAELGRLHFSRSHSFLEKTGVYPGQPPLLFALYKENGQSQKDLANKMRIKPATMTVMIKRMEKTNFIERSQDENDQRISRINITEKGIKVCEHLIVISKEIEKECFQNFTQDEKMLLRRLLMQMRDNLVIGYDKVKENQEMEDNK
ncbi:MAG TPA: MarR family transcriptional regulator [Clostridium sp.]